MVCTGRYVQTVVLAEFKLSIRVSLLLLIKNKALLLSFLLATYVKVVFKSVTKRSELPCPGECVNMSEKTKYINSISPQMQLKAATNVL